MSQEIKELLEKIKEEGVKVAEENAATIEQEAHKNADEIVTRAKKEAGVLLSQAQEKIGRMQANSESLLKQAGRDLVLALKKEILTMLERTLSVQIRETLTPGATAQILNNLIVQCSANGKEETVVYLAKDQLSEIQEALFKQLKHELKKQVILKSSEGVSGGFIISYDAGKSHFDFSDKALAEYIGTQLKPSLAQILG